MTEVDCFLQTLSLKGVQLWPEEGRLRYRGPEKALSPQLLGDIAGRKAALLRHFSEPARGPLSPGQLGLWYIQNSLPESSAYNVSVAFRIHSDFELPFFLDALQLLLNRHACLRASFPLEGEAPVQKIEGYRPVSLKVIETGAATDEELRAALIAAHELPFRLETGPLFRAHLFANAVAGPVVLVSAHHIVIDGWSVYVLLDDLFVLYDAVRRGVPASLPPIESTFAHYVAWQTAYLSEHGERLWSYWKQQLRGDLPVLQVPGDFERPPRPTYRSVTRPFELSADLTDRLKQVARRNGCTLYVVLLAAWQVLLHRYSGQEDLITGLPMAGRSRPEFADLVGYFASPVPLRANLTGNPSFSQLLIQVRTRLLEALDHQDFPFALMVERLNPARDAGRSPVFQADFVFQKSDRAPDLVCPRGIVKHAGLSIESIPLSRSGAEMDLSLEMLERHAPETMERHGSLIGNLALNADLFAASSAARMAGNFVELLEGIASNPGLPIGELPLLTAHERRRILEEWNRTDMAFPADRCFHELFEDQVERAPDAVAIVFGDRQLTYRELNSRANQLAHHLRNFGVVPETFVGISLERSIEMVVGVLGILKAGGAYVPLDPGYPAERLTYMLDDTGVRVILTRTGLRHRLPVSAHIVVDLDADSAQISSRSTENPVCTARPRHLAFVIYTSGSTGRPKGVLIEHGSLTAFSTATRFQYELTPKDRVLQFATISFAAANNEIYPCLIAGGTLVLRDEAMLGSAEAFIEGCRERGITVLAPPTAFWHFLTGEIAKSKLSLPACVRLVTIGGERARASAARLWARHVGEYPKLINEYGQTESVVISIRYSFTGAFGLEDLPIGTPAPNVRAYVLDERLNPVPIGVVGELHLGGPQVARGYLNRKDLTDRQFISNPFGSGLLYKTGDLVRHLPDGNLIFAGRVDEQIKLRGFRIEPAEIESILQTHPQIDEAAVVAVGDGDGDPSGIHLVACLVTELKDSEFAAVRDFLGRLLPAYMMPSRFVAIDELPMTPSGKIDRKRLAGHVGVSRPPAREIGDFVPPRTSLERKLAEIWRALLRLDRVSIHDNFFALGGDSIRSLQVVSRARQLGLEIAPNQIFQHQTIAALAAVLDHDHFQSPAALKLRWTPDEPEMVEGAAPLTPIQEWWASLDLANPDAYNLSTLMELDSAVDPDCLREAFAVLIRYHDSLRLRYRKINEVWLQEFGAPDEIVLREFDVTGLSPAARREKIVEATAEIEGAIRIENGPLVAAALLRRRDRGSSQLVLAIHHLAVDWVSWRILLEDLETVYRQLLHAQTVELPPKTTSFQRWARWLREEAPRLVAGEIPYWQSCFEGIRPLPVDFTAGEPTLASLEIVTACLSAAETQALLRRAPSAYGTQINDLLLTALLQTLAAWSGQSSLPIEMEGHGREPIPRAPGADFEDETGFDLSRTVGWLTSSFPVRLNLRHRDLASLIPDVKDQLRRTPNRGMGFGILRHLVREPSLASVPMPSVGFNYLGQFDDPPAARGLFRSTGMESFMAPGAWEDRKSAAMFVQNGATKLWNLFAVESMVVQGELRVFWEYSAAVHRRATVERLAGEFVARLRDIIAHCIERDEQPVFDSKVAMVLA